MPEGPRRADRRAGPALARALACLALWLCAWACWSSCALAGSLHIAAGSFGAAGSSPANPYPLGAVLGLAVDNSPGPSAHDIYATDPTHFRIEKFDASGSFILMFGKEVNKTKVLAKASEAEQNVCALASGDECQSGVQGAEGKGQLSNPAFVAVDSSAGPSSGDVYVGDRGTSVVYKFSSAGAFISENNGAGSGEAFASIEGVALDAAGNLSTLARNGPFIFRFDEAGSFIAPPFSTGGARPEGLTIDAGGASYFVEGFEAVEKLDSSGNKVGRVAAAPFEGGALMTGLVADQLSSDLYLDTGTEIEHIAPSCDPAKGLCAVADAFGFAQLSAGAGLGIDSSNGTLYVAEGAGEILRFALGLEANSGPAAEIGASTASVQGSVNPEGALVSECVFEYGTSGEYEQSAPCVESVGEGSAPVAVHAELKGLSGAGAYHYRILARSANGVARGEDESFTTLATPTIDEALATEVSASSAVLTARINPHAIATEYRFEYDTVPYQSEAPHGTSAPIPDAQIGSGTSAVAVSQAIGGLSANTTYHFRVVLKDAHGETVTGADHTFVFIEEAPEVCANQALRGGLSAGLPDCRGYEMVSPPQKDAALIGALFLGQVAPQISEDGSRVTVPSIQCFATAKSCVADRQSEGQPYELTRASGEWRANPLAPPADQFQSDSWWSFGADVGTALFSIPSPPNGQDDFYLREGDGAFTQVGPVGEGDAAEGALSTRPMLSSSAPARTLYGTSNPVWSFDHGAGNAASLYEYSDTNSSAPELVGVSGGAHSTDLISACGTAVGPESGAPSRTYNSLSADGRIVYFTVKPCATGTGANAGKAVAARELYERIDQAHTVQVSIATPSGCTSAACEGAPAGDAVFEGASSDGERALFTSVQQLSDEASGDRHAGDSASEGGGSGCAKTAASASGCNLYESECPSHCEDPAQRRLIDISAGAQASGGPRVQGAVAISPDASHVYFVAKGVLTAVKNKQGKGAQEEAENLYLYERDGEHPSGRLSFIATLAGADRALWTGGSGNGQGIGVANVTPEGRLLAFESHRALSADARPGEGPAQVYLYDSQSEEMTRVSHGKAGFNDDGNAGKAGTDASIAPARYAFEVGNGPARANPTMSDDGRYVFFQSPVALAPGALSEARTGGTTEKGGEELAANIYEWEAQGTGTCKEAAGCVSLISDGKDDSPSGKISVFSPELLGTDASGENVFFATNSQLSAKDGDTQRDYYDARIGGGDAPEEAKAPCEGEACRAPGGVAPAFGALGSLGIGAGGDFPRHKLNPLTRAQRLTKALKRCRAKHSKPKRTSCERRARKRFGAKHKHKRRSERMLSVDERP